MILSGVLGTEAGDTSLYCRWFPSIRRGGTIRKEEGEGNRSSYWGINKHKVIIFLSKNAIIKPITCTVNVH